MSDYPTTEEAPHEWQPIATAPKDGRKVLLQFKQDLPERAVQFSGLSFVGRWGGRFYEWSFAAPVGMGGFPDDWIEAWHPLPPASQPLPADSVGGGSE